MLFIGGTVYKEPYIFDIDNNDNFIILLIESGKVVALNIRGELLWTSEFILANTIYTVDDLTGNDKKEVVVFGDNQLIILDAHTGDVLHVQDFMNSITKTRFILNDFDKDGKKEAVISVYGDSNIYVYKFIYDNGDFVVRNIKQYRW